MALPGTVDVVGDPFIECVSDLLLVFLLLIFSRKLKLLSMFYHRKETENV